jgi:hypothetical protein
MGLSAVCGDAAAELRSAWTGETRVPTLPRRLHLPIPQLTVAVSHCQANEGPTPYNLLTFGGLARLFPRKARRGLKRL